MAIKSSIGELTLFDLFQILYHNQKTGRLIITDSIRERGAHILFKNGFVCFAYVYDKAPKSIEIVLKEWGVVDEISAAEIDNKWGRYNSPLDCLNGEGISSRNYLETFISARVKEAVYSILKWENGDYHFIEEEIDEKRECFVMLKTVNLILEGARRIDEWSNIQSKVPSRHTVFKFCEGKEKQQLNLKPKEWEILSLIDGGRSVFEINEEVGEDLFSTSKLIYGLVVMGVIEGVENNDGPGSDISKEDIIEKHLRQGRIFYNRLDLKKAMVEYEKVVQIDSHCFEALRMLGEIYYKMDMLSESLRFLEKAREQRPDNQKAMFIKGYLHAKLGEVEEAISEWQELKEKAESRKIIKLVEDRISVARDWSRVMAEY
ncbi:MAG: DUF4388 domain-containing protein [Candidatus Krumholzibacteriota bacterium]|nr:DUF4388 domain-containing protein [Candidatus Krumholzibacteriota bacterium]